MACGTSDTKDNPKSILPLLVTLHLFFFFTGIVTEKFHCPPVERLCVTLFPLFRTPRLPHTSSSSAWQRRNATEDSGRWRRCRPFCPTPRSSKSTNAPADDDGPSGDDARDAGAHQTDGRWRPTAWPSPPTTCPFFSFGVSCPFSRPTEKNYSAD